MAIWPKRQSIGRRKAKAADIRKALARYANDVDDKRSERRLDDLAHITGALSNLVATETGQDHMESIAAVREIHQASLRLRALASIAKEMRL